MIFEIKKESIFKALALIEKIAGKNPSLPILDCIMIEAGKHVTLASTNLEIGAQIEVTAKVASKGKIAVPASILYRVVMNSGSDLIKFEVKNTTLSVTSGKENSVLKLHPVEDFPSIPGVEGGKTTQLHAQELLRGIKSVWYSASTSLIKPEIASVYIHSEGKKIVFAATDSFRLAEKVLPASGGGEFGPLLIPTRSVGDVIRILEGMDGEVTISFNDHQVSFSGEGVYLTARLGTGTFPNYREIIPKRFTSEVVVLKNDLLSALKKTGVFLDSFQQIHLAVHPKKKSFTISVNNAEIGSTEHPVPAAITGETLDINFNQKYIVDCLPSVTADSLTLGFNGLGKPLVIRGVSDNTYTSLVMPMNR